MTDEEIDTSVKFVQLEQNSMKALLEKEIKQRSENVSELLTHFINCHHDLQFEKEKLKSLIPKEFQQETGW